MALPAKATASEVLAYSQGLAQVQRITEGITGRQVATVLKDAAKEAEALIAKNLAGGVGNQVRAAQLRAAMKGIGVISTELWTGVGKITKVGMFEAAQLAADQAIDRDFLLGMPGLAIIQYAEQIHFEARHVVEDLVSRRTAGFQLQERIYANGRLSVKQAAEVVERGLALQMSAKEIASRVKHLYDPSVPGGTSYAAMRLGRTEINNAHHETSIRMSKDRPWVVGYKWNLSGSHPRPDACNDYAERDHSGLGRGVFSKATVPSKPHPMCLCYLTHIQKPPKEFMDDLVDGQYDDWLDSKHVGCPV